LGFEIRSAAGAFCVPLATYGFPWKESDFQRIHPVGDYATELISRRHTRPGWGVPVTVQRSGARNAEPTDSYLAPRAAFVATIVMRPEAECWIAGAADDPLPATLEAYDPLRVTALDVDGVQMPLAADFSAGFAFSAIAVNDGLSPLLWFLEPDEVEGEGLYFLEPYQPGKIPIVLIHGLLSDPKTWIDLANDLRPLPGFDQHYQIWIFRYATGREFLASAAHLRHDLQDAIRVVDPTGADAATRQIVLVGHSMGGLVAKLQVVSSGDHLWRSVANRPLGEVVADSDTRAALGRVFFFERVPYVRRVVFLATPHGGSSWAARPVGRFAACLARRDNTNAQRFQEIVASNPEIFSEQVERRLPTSVDMLNRRSQLLQTISGLPIPPEVPFHSVIGTGRPMCGEPADGVVPVSSARLPGAESELYVEATHTQVHRRPETVREVARILCRHLASRSDRRTETTALPGR
jgi:hypothetical protein